MLQAALKVTSGKQAGETISLSAGKFLVGREEDCHLRPNSDLVSRHHCVFTLDEYALRVRDLGSTNGTLVNGERIRGGVVLNAGDAVSVGSLEFEIIIDDPSAEDTQTEFALGADTQLDLLDDAGDSDTGSRQIISADDDSDVQEPSPGENETPWPQQPNSSAPGDTHFAPQQGMPPQQHLGYPPGMYPQQMMPYGYPGFQGMYPQQMGYPGAMPGMYPQQPMPQQEQPQEPQSQELPVRLPDPSQTGAKSADAPDPNAKPEEKTAEAEAKEQAPVKAADIIQQYLKRRPGGGEG